MMPNALRVGSLSLILVVCALASVQVFAQMATATLSGVINDPKGAVVPDTEVVATRIETGTVVKTKTNGAGIYVLTALMPGHYHLLIHRAGFKEIAIKEFELHVQDKLEQNFSLEIGSVSETVTVNANAEHMATDDPAVGVLVNRDFVENMPLNGRSFQDLIALAPGAVSSNPISNNATNPGLFSINGQQTNANYFTVDGVAANLNPSPGSAPGQGAAGTLPSQTVLGTTQSLTSLDTLQEFKIQTSGYAAEYGRQPGGQIELTTRSGTNEVHGSLFDYLRNDAFDANSWYNDANGIPKEAERQNDFGGTVGGDVKVPSIYDGKDKTFYFASYEGLRLTTPGSSGGVSLPTLALRQFAAPSVAPFLNSLPLPNGKQNNDSCAASLGSAYDFSCTAQWNAAWSNPSGLDSLSFRVDQNIGKRARLFLRYFDTSSWSNARQYWGSEIDATTINLHGWTAGATIYLKSDLIDEIRFNYSTTSGSLNTSVVAFDGSVPYSKSLIVPRQYSPGSTTSQGVLAWNLANSNNFPFPGYGDSFNHQQQYNLIDNISWAFGTHSLKFGLDYRRLSFLYGQTKYFSEFVFISPQAIQQGFADQAYVFNAAPAYPSFNNLSLYAQDHWRVLSRLSLDYGLRWELNPPPGATNGQYPLALTTSNLSEAQIAPAGTPQYHTRFNNFAPRLGFAYQLDPTNEHPVVIRGGFGIFYNTGQAQAAVGYSGYPFYAFNQVANLSLPATASALAPPPLNLPLTPPYQGLTGISDPNLKVPYTEQWNLSLDLALAAKNTLTINYVGNNGKQLLFTTFNQSIGSINPNFTTIQYTSNAASSNYNALQVQDQGYVAPGLQLIASYTWAHAIDNASSDQAGGSAPVRGNSDNDVRQVLNLAFNYRIPGDHHDRILRALTTGWSLDDRFTAQTGFPLYVYQGIYFLPDGESAFIRPDLTPGVPIYLHDVPGNIGGWGLNPAAFSSVPLNPDGSPTMEGSLGRNFVHGPDFWNVNVAIQRAFPIHERLQLLFRVDAFNVLNHPNAGTVDICTCDTTFGKSFGTVATIGVPNQLYATGSPRSLQFALKLQF
jgi:Carboxypeptidase regulatory-like domain/TonB dependent receptor